jgi:ABC-type multidrug transport system fused ATPase/permease subunit
MGRDGILCVSTSLAPVDQVPTRSAGHNVIAARRVNEWVPRVKTVNDPLVFIDRVPIGFTRGAVVSDNASREIVGISGPSGCGKST